MADNKNIISNHEQIYQHLKVIKGYMDLAMDVFEGQSPEELEEIRERIYIRTRKLFLLLVECRPNG